MQHDLLPIEKISSDLKQFRADLKSKLDELNINNKLNEPKPNEKKHSIKNLKHLLGDMSAQLKEEIANLPRFGVEATLDENAGLEKDENVIDSNMNAALVEREKALARLRDEVGELDQQVEEKKDVQVINEVKAVGKLAEIRVEEEVAEKTNCCTRTFCCFFPQSKQKLEELSSEKVLKQQETAAAIQKLEAERERVRIEAQKKAEIDHAAIAERIDATIVLVKAKAAAKVNAERGYEAYKYTVSEGIMLSLIRINSCVRRIDEQLSVASKATESTPLLNLEMIKKAKEFIGGFDKALEAQCKLLFCVNPDDDGHKIYFKDFYRRYHPLKNEEKFNILNGEISEAARKIIFSWEIPLQLRALLSPAVTSSPLRRDSFRK